MASISSLSGSGSSSSIYGNRTYNIISGLASGLDTEELISGVVQSYQQKIQSLQQENTSLQWQQEAYQSISDKLVEFYRNYSSYVYSENNLSSSGFFSGAVTTTANGINAAMITASGKSSSSVMINAVKQLATASRYINSAKGLDSSISTSSDGKYITTTGSGMSDLTEDVELSKLSGSLTLNYGDRTVSIDFGERELFTTEDGKFDPEAFEKAINEKLSEQQISTSSGTMVDADTRIGVEVDNAGRVSFYDKSGAGNSVSIAGASGNLEKMIFDLDDVVSAESGTFKLNLDNGVVEEKPMAEYLSGKSITVTLDGKSKTIKLPEVTVDSANPNRTQTNKDFQEALQAELDKAFGSGKITVAKDGGNELAFTVGAGSSLAVSSSNEDVNDVLGIGSGLTSYLDTTKTLKDLNIDLSKLPGRELKGVGAPTQKVDEDGNPVTDSDGNPVYVDQNGETVDKDGYLLDEDGKRKIGYDLVINDVTIGTYTKDTELNTIINNINSNTEAGVNVSYSKTTGQFVFTAKDTGAGGRIEIEGSEASPTLGSALFGAVDPDTADSSVYTAGVDAEIVATINGQKVELKRSSNTFDLDGMSVTLNGTFEAATDADAVTFTSKTDADKVVDVVKKMVEDLNTILKEVKSAYSDMPLKKSDGTTYDPLTDEDMTDMSESAIEAYEEKAKTGILFMDSDLSSLYGDLVGAISSSGADGVTLRSIGLETAYSDGLTTITFDEKKFREALESDPDKVQQAFTKSKENGAATDGLMASLTSITDKYAATSGSVKGILIEKAGSQYSPSAALDNTLLNQMEEVEEEISKWQDKMSNKVDYYTNKFTQLELLINEMNSQSSALAGLLGG